jgi:hypothetical protein
MATDRRLNCNIIFVKRSDGTYQMHLFPKKDSEQDDENSPEPEEGETEETPEELRVRGISFDNQIGCDEIVQQFISGLSEYR